MTREEAKNVDCSNRILRALTLIGPCSKLALADWLGHPYAMDASLKALVASGEVVETFETGRWGGRTTYSLPS